MALGKANYKMVELARLSRGYTQKELSDLLPTINQSNLSKIEKGLLSVSNVTARNIGNILHYPVEFFYQEELKTPLSSIYFRKRATIAQKSLDKIFSDLRIVLKSIDVLMTDIELKQFPRYSFDLTSWTPETAATRMREVLKIPAGPISDVVNTIEEEGIVVYFYDCPEEKFDGLTAYTDKGTPVICVNKHMPPDRIKNSICHELGHLVAHIPCNVEPWRDVEEEANRFASEFLMPAVDCANDLKGITFKNLTMLKAYWGVSKASIIRRAKTLGTINESSYKYLMIELGRRNERKQETGFVEIDEPNILNEVIKILKGDLFHTETSIAEMLCLNISDYSRYFENDKQVRLKIGSLKRAI